MTRTLALVALTFAAVSAHAQTGRSVVVRDTPDGLTTSAPDDRPVGDSASALLTRTPQGAWRLQALSTGDVPSHVAARPFPALPALSSETRLQSGVGRLGGLLARLEGDVVALGSQPGRASAVVYTVAASLVGDGPDPSLVAALADDPAMASLEVNSDAGQTQIEARFSFASVAEWSEWSVRSETRTRLHALRAGAGRQRTSLNVQKR